MTGAPSSAPLSNESPSSPSSGGIGLGPSGGDASSAGACCGCCGCGAAANAARGFPGAGDETDTALDADAGRSSPMGSGDWLPPRRSWPMAEPVGVVPAVDVPLGERGVRFREDEPEAVTVYCCSSAAGALRRKSLGPEPPLGCRLVACTMNKSMGSTEPARRGTCWASWLSIGHRC